MNKRTNTALQNITQKTKDRENTNPTKYRDELMLFLSQYLPAHSNP